MYLPKIIAFNAKNKEYHESTGGQHQHILVAAAACFRYGEAICEREIGSILLHDEYIKEIHSPCRLPHQMLMPQGHRVRIHHDAADAIPLTVRGSLREYVGQVLA